VAFDDPLLNRGFLSLVAIPGPYRTLSKLTIGIGEKIANSSWEFNDGGLPIFSVPVVWSVTAVPEPSLMVLLGISVMSLAGLRRLWKD